MNYIIKFHRFLKNVKSTLQIEFKTNDEDELKEKIRKEFRNLKDSGWSYEDCLKLDESQNENDSKKEESNER